VNTTATYYIKTAADGVRNAMTKLETSIPQTQSGTVETLDVRDLPTPTSLN